MLLNRTLITIILFMLMDIRKSTATNNVISGLMYKIVENETITSNTSDWFKIKSNVYCCAFCLRDPPCTGFQFGDVVNENVTTTSCNLLYENVSLQTRESMPGISVYSLEREHTASTTQMPGSTTPVSGSTTPVPGSTTPLPGSATPVSGSTTPVPGSTTPVSGSTTPVPGSTTPISGTTTPVPGSTTVPPLGPCAVDAAFTLEFDIVIISGAWIHIYNSSENLKVGPVQQIPVQTYLPGWSGTVDAAYMDSDKTLLYMIAGNEVKTYRFSDKVLLSTETIDQHFSSFSVVPAVIDGAIYFNNTMILISSDMVYTTNGSVPLATQGSTNVFTSLNPLTITGVTGVTSSRSVEAPLFFAGDNIHNYTPYFITKLGAGLWNEYGTLKCLM